MILQINHEEINIDIPAQLNISELATLRVDDGVLLLKFNENLKSPVDSEYNRDLREQIQAERDDFRVVDCRSISVHGKKPQFLSRRFESKFEALGVKPIMFKQDSESIEQNVSNTITLRNALIIQQERDKVLVAISTSAIEKDVSCVAIIKFDENDSQRNQAFFLANTPLARVYRQWSYFLVDNLSTMLTKLLTTHAGSFDCFFNTKNEILIPIEPEVEPILAVTWVGKNGQADKSSFFYPGEKMPAELQGGLGQSKPFVKNDSEDSGSQPSPG